MHSKHCFVNAAALLRAPQAGSFRTYRCIDLREKVVPILRHLNASHTSEAMQPGYRR